MLQFLCKKGHIIDTKNTQVHSLTRSYKKKFLLANKIAYVMMYKIKYPLNAMILEPKDNWSIK